MKKLHFKLLLVVIVVVCALLVVFLVGNPSLLLGKITSKLVFFREAPVKEQVFDSSMATYKSASSSLIRAALKSQRINDAQAKAFFDKYASTQKITRSEFAALAVEIFNLTEQGTGPTVNDPPVDKYYVEKISTCISNGCFDIDFKPYNPATLQFVDNVASNLTKRFSSGSN